MEDNNKELEEFFKDAFKDSKGKVFTSKIDLPIARGMKTVLAILGFHCLCLLLIVMKLYLG